MSKEKFGNGYRGGAARRKMMPTRSVGFVHHNRGSLKQVHMQVDNRSAARSFAGGGWAGIR
jgi:hypothetical protein